MLHCSNIHNTKIRGIRLCHLLHLKKSNFQDLLSKAENLNKSETKAGPDERLWKPEVDKAGNGYAVIRFLPAPDGEDLPWAQVWSHAFQGPWRLVYRKLLDNFR